MTDRPYWCEICARKKECYGITLKPKCFVPTADRKAEPTRSKMEQVDRDINVRSKEPQIEYCPRCGMRILVDKPKDEPQTCSFSDCDNFKNPDYERCIECKRKQIKLKTEQMERSSE